MNELENIRQLVAEGNTQEALKGLVLFLEKNNENLSQSAIIISARWNYLQKNKFESTITNSEAGIELNRINQSILGLIQIYGDNSTLNNKIILFENRQKKGILLLIGLFLSCLYLLVIVSESNKYRIEAAKKEDYIKNS
jgi:hypothetical protein